MWWDLKCYKPLHRKKRGNVSIPSGVSPLVACDEKFNDVTGMTNTNRIQLNIVWEYSGQSNPCKVQKREGCYKLFKIILATTSLTRKKVFLSLSIFSAIFSSLAETHMTFSYRKRNFLYNYFVRKDEIYPMALPLIQLFGFSNFWVFTFFIELAISVTQEMRPYIILKWHFKGKGITHL